MDKVGRAQHIRNQLSELGTLSNSKQPSVRQLNKLGGGDESTISKILNGDDEVLETVRESSFLQLERTVAEMYLAFGHGKQDRPQPDFVWVDETGQVAAVGEAKATRQGVVVVKFEGVSGSSLEIKKITVESPADELPDAIDAVRRLFEQAQTQEDDVDQ